LQKSRVCKAHIAQHLSLFSLLGTQIMKVCNTSHDADFHD